jgi:hypothetical protein
VAAADGAAVGRTRRRRVAAADGAAVGRTRRRRVAAPAGAAVALAKHGRAQVVRNGGSRVVSVAGGRDILGYSRHL